MKRRDILQIQPRLQAQTQRPPHLLLTLREVESAILDWNAHHGRPPSFAEALHCFEMAGLKDRKADVEWLNRHQGYISQNSSAELDHSNRSGSDRLAANSAVVSIFSTTALAHPAVEGEVLVSQNLYRGHYTEDWNRLTLITLTFRSKSV